MKTKCCRCSSYAHVGCLICEKVFCAYHSQVHHDGNYEQVFKPDGLYESEVEN